MNATLFRDLPTERWWSMERYADELARALASFDCRVQNYVSPHPFANLRGRPNAIVNQLWRSLVYPVSAKWHQGDVNHIIDHTYAHLLHTLDAKRTAVTCHDIAPLALNEGYGISRQLWNHSFRAMSRASYVLADSTFTRDEILRHLDYSAHRIVVVPLAVGADFLEPVSDADVSRLRNQYQLVDRQVILHVGSCAARKNIQVILRAMKDFRNEEVCFIQLGGQFAEEQKTQISALGIGGRVIQLPPMFGYDLRLFYHLADIFVFPSYYEGFGMPVLEAMVSGTPVVCANASALPEVAGDAAILTDPHDSTKLAEQIRNVLADVALASELRQRGLARAREFTWARTARETFAVYQRIASE